MYLCVYLNTFTQTYTGDPFFFARKGSGHKAQNCMSGAAADHYTNGTKKHQQMTRSTTRQQQHQGAPMRSQGPCPPTGKEQRRKGNGKTTENTTSL